MRYIEGLNLSIVALIDLCEWCFETIRLVKNMTKINYPQTIHVLGLRS